MTKNIAFVTTLTKEHINLGMGVRTLKFAHFLKKYTNYNVVLWNSIPLPIDEHKKINEIAKTHNLIFNSFLINNKIDTSNIFTHITILDRIISIPKIFAKAFINLEYDYIWIFQPAPQHIMIPLRKVFSQQPISQRFLLDWPMDYSVMNFKNIRRLYNLITLNFIDGITVPNIELVNEIKKNTIKKANRIFLLPHGIDLSNFSPIKNIEAKKKLGLENNYILLRMGSYTRMPITPLIPLVKKLKKKLDNILLISIGGTELQIKNARSIVKASKLERNIKVYGTVPEKSLPFYIAAADVCLFYDTNIKRKDFPTKLLYYMAMRKPIVALKTAGIEYTMKKSVLFVNTIEEFYNAVILLNKKSSIADSLSEEAYKEVKKYDWKVIVKKFQHILDSI